MAFRLWRKLFLSRASEGEKSEILKQAEEEVKKRQIQIENKLVQVGSVSRVGWIRILSAPDYLGMRIPNFFPRTRIQLSWKKNSDPALDPTLIRNGEKLYLYIR